MCRLLLILSALIVWSSQVLAVSPEEAKNDALVDKMTMTFLTRNDQAGLELFSSIAHDRNWAQRTNLYAQMRTTTTDGELLRKSMSLLGKGSSSFGGPRGEAIGKVIDLAMDATDLGVLATDKYLSPVKTPSTFAETRKAVALAIADAKKYGSFDVLMRGFGERHGSSWKQGEAPLDIEKQYELEKDTFALLRTAKDSKEQMAILRQRAATIENGYRLILDRLPSEQEIKESRQRDLAERNFQKRQVSIDVLNSKLSIVSSLASAFQIKELEVPVAIGQMYAGISTAANIRQRAVDATTDQAVKSSANWVMAASVVGIVVVAYQTYANSKKDVAMQKALAQIMQQLSAIDQKLDVLTKITREGFENVIGRIDRQQFVINVLLLNSNKNLEMQTQAAVKPYVDYNNAISSEYRRWINLCASKSKDCDPQNFYKKMRDNSFNENVVDARHFDIDSFENISNLTISLPSDDLKNYRQYQSSTYLLNNLKTVVSERLNDKLPPIWTNFYLSADRFLNLDWNLPNGKLWYDTISLVKQIQNASGVRAPRELVDQLFKEGKKLKLFDDSFSKKNILHALMTMELQLEAGRIMSQIKSIHRSLNEAFVNQFDAEGKLVRAASITEYPDVSRLPTCQFGEGPYRERSSSGLSKEALRTFLESTPATEQLGYFRILQNLGYGSISPCAQWIEGTYKTPKQMEKYGVRLVGGGYLTARYYQVILHFRFKWNEKAALDEYTRDQKDLSIFKVRTFTGNYNYWEKLGANRNQLFKVGDVTALDDKKMDSIRQAISSILNEEIAGELSSRESFAFSSRKPRFDGKISVLKNNPHLLSSLLKTFDRYRLRFYLYKAFVQQSVLAGTSNDRCKSALTEPDYPERIASMGQTPGQAADAYPVNLNVHPLSIIDGIQTGLFMSRITSVERFIKKSLRTNDDKYYACQSVQTSPYIMAGFSRLAAVGRNSFMCQYFWIGCAGVRQ